MRPIFVAPSPYCERSMERFEPSHQANNQVDILSEKIPTFLPLTTAPTAVYHQDSINTSQRTRSPHSEIDRGRFIEKETLPNLLDVSFPPISYWYEGDYQRMRPNVPVPQPSLPSSLQALALHSPIPEKEKDSSSWWAHFLSYFPFDGLIPN